MENLENHGEYKPTPVKEPSNLSFYLKVILAAALLGTGYFAFDRWGNNLFGSEKKNNDSKLDQKNIIGENGDLKLSDTIASNNAIDSSSALYVDSSSKIKSSSTDDNNIIKADPEFDSLLTLKKEAKITSIVNKYATDEAVFEALTSSNGYNDKKQFLLNKFRGNQIFSLETSLKLLSMAGLNILTNKETDADHTILSLIKDQKNLSNFYVIDKEGVIYYDAKTNMLYAKISDITSSVVLSANNLDINEASGLTVLSYPIYHSFGKIGFIVLMMKNGLN